MELDFSADQEKALLEVMEWRNALPRQFLVMGGYAGTGKSTLISHLAAEWQGVAVCALCGKAAQVLRDKGAEATTIHGLIYVPFKDAQGKFRFERRRHLCGVRTIIVDEASMIDEVLFSDLLSFRLPVLFVGDHGQLEPIGDNPNLMKAPDVRLENIHRQAKDNPILQVATAFREGRTVPNWSDKSGRLHVITKGEFEHGLQPGCQIICGYRKTRHEVNRWMRAKNGFDRFIVHPGERLICLRNNRLWKMFNGQQVNVLDVYCERKQAIALEVETDDGRVFTVECLKEQFGRDLDANCHRQDLLHFDYGYCITAHKAQGSEWNSVAVFEEIASAWDARRWRYTVATRAKERLVYCR
jgi:exodeoxyribonuclease-5